MANTVRNEYTPDVVSPPGTTLQEALDEREMTQAELARRTGRPTKTINEIIKSKAAITPDTALQLEHVLGIPASFWNRRECAYREYLARVAETERLESAWAWVSRFPVSVMARQGWIARCSNRAEQARELLGYFQVASPEAWQLRWEGESASFRLAKAFEANEGALAAWLRQGEIRAESVECAPFDKQAFKEVLADVRALTTKPLKSTYIGLVELCASAGVAVVFVPQLPKSPASGATRWMDQSRALIQLSLRYKRDDQFWFSFFHEAGHICLHGRRDVFVEEERGEKKLEDEADRFAANFLVPRTDYRRFVNDGVFDEKSIRHFAQRVGIASGIVVGRLQHDKLVPFNSSLNHLKRPAELPTGVC